MTSRHPTTRDDAPAYLARYRERRGEDPAPVDYADANQPAYLLRARERSAERSRFDQVTGEAPPDRSEAYAFETAAPRELDVAEPFRRRLTGSTDVRLLRHGQTQGYVSDAALTDTGRWQAHRKGQDLAKGVTEGMTVHLLHAPTPRAAETAVGVYEGVLQGIARYGIPGATVLAPVVAEEFDNFQAYCPTADGGTVELDVTAAFQRYATALEHHNSTASGERPGWMVEMDRFWKVEAGGGDPITHWLTQPTQYLEPAALVVRRFWRGITTYVGRATPGEAGPQRIFVCTHSGPIRAVAAHAVGHDPGEPYNLEDVRIRVFRDLDRAIVTYRGRGVEIEIPSTVTPSWFA